jgi:hypothetical protein
MTYLLDDKISFDNTPNLDSFGRLRTSTPFTLFDSFQRFDKDPNFSESITGSGTSTYDSNSATILCTVSTSGDRVIRETNKIFAYQPGKSLLSLRTFSFSTEDNLIQRIGYFDANDGVFLERTGTTVNLVKRSSVTGTVQELRVPKTAWNVDRLDGAANTTNPSGLSLNIAATQIFFTDYEWLGVGTVRCGFIIDGDFYVAHKFHHANQTSTANNNTTLPYMKTACLPLRSEIESTGGAGSLRLICSSLLSEGGYELRGRPRSAGHEIGVGRQLTNLNQLYPIMAIRLKSSRLNGVAIPKNYQIAALNAGNFRYVIMSGQTSGGTWANTGSDSIVEYNLTANSVNIGNVTHEMGFIASTNQAAGTAGQVDVPFRYQLDRNPFTGTATEFIIAISTTTNNPNVCCSINWEEIT